MKAVLISIQPQWCKLIADGRKTVEVRKTHPKLETPFKCYIYCTYGQGLIERYDAVYPNVLIDQTVSKNAIWGNCCNGKVIGEFVCDKIIPIKVFPNGTIQDYMFYNIEQSFVAYDDIVRYIGNDRTGYGWHISDLLLYDKPKELREFQKPSEPNEVWYRDISLKKPPQSWCYVEEV